MSSPTRVHGNSIEVGVSYAHPPHRVRDIMTATALGVAGVLARPAPVAEVVRFDPSAIAYRLTYWIDDFPRNMDIECDLRAHLWYAFQRTGTEMPSPIVHAYTRPLDEARAAADDARRARVAALLPRIDFLAALRPEQIEELARGAHVALYPAGATIFRQGEAGDSLFVVAAGRAEIVGEPPGGGVPFPIGYREVGDYFGEMSLLTDAPRPFDVRAAEDSELVVLTREVTRPILVADPSVAERLSQTLSRHVAGDQKVLTEFMGRPPAHAAYQANTLLGNIRRAFGLVNLER
jgi:CRP-like cAMP-binding protein